MTDAFLLMGLLDPASYFGGELKIDAERARAAIAEKVAKPLGLTEEQAAQAMEDAWVAKIAISLKEYTDITPDTTLAAFGGAGPFVVCKVAEAAGISRVIIPGLAAVFSAFGIGFSDIAHRFEAPLASNDAAGLKACREQLRERATARHVRRGRRPGAVPDRGNAAHQSNGEDRTASLQVKDGKLPSGLPRDARLSLALEVVKPIAHAELSGRFGKAGKPAVAQGKRRTLAGGQWRQLPLYRVEDQPPGCSAQGPAVLEEAFFTCRIETGWKFEINQAGDILLSRA